MCKKTNPPSSPQAWKKLALVLVFAIFATGCTSVSAKKDALFLSNRLCTVGYTFTSNQSGLDDEGEELPWRKSCLLLALPGWTDVSERTCYNIALSPLISFASAIQGIQLAPWAITKDLYGLQASLVMAGARNLNGIQVALLLSRAEKGHGIQCAGLVCVSERWNGLAIAPLNICLEKNSSIQIGLISLVTRGFRGEYKPSPALGQLSLVNATFAEQPRRGFHWQGGLWNFYEVASTDWSGVWHDLIENKEEKGFLFQFGFVNDASGRAAQMQLGVFNTIAGNVAPDESKIQCGIVNCRNGSEFVENGFGLQFGLVNRSYVGNKNDKDRTVQIGLLNLKHDGWSLFLNW